MASRRGLISLRRTPRAFRQGLRFSSQSRVDSELTEAQIAFNRERRGKNAAIAAVLAGFVGKNHGGRAGRSSQKLAERAHGIDCACWG